MAAPRAEAEAAAPAASAPTALPERHRRRRSRRRLIARAGAVALLLGVVALIAWRLGYFDLRDPRKLAQAVERARARAWIGPIFVGAYAVLASLSLPVSPLALGAGAIFGWVRGSWFVWVGSLIGATAGYWMARGVGGGLARKAREAGEGAGRMRKLIRVLHRGNGFLPVMRLQLLPVVPFGLLNAAAGVAHVPFFWFLAASSLGIIPGTVAYVYLGEQILAGIAGAERRAFLWAGLVGLGLVVLSFVPTLLKRMHAARGDRLGGSPGDEYDVLGEEDSEDDEAADKR